MIRWIFLFVVAAILVWMFADSRASRMIGLGVLGFVAAVAFTFFHFFERPEVNPPTDGGVERVEKLTQRLETERFSLTPGDIALVGTELRPDSRVSYDNSGKRVETPNLFSWTVEGEARNISEQHTVQDVYLRIRLFDCPPFFTTEQARAELGELDRTCSRIGERNLGLYDLEIAPGSTMRFRDSVSFSDQVEPRNWRYWISVDRVNALAR